MDRVKENVIEWLDGDQTVTCTFSQKKFVNRIKRMAENHASSVKILAENHDGSILASIPLSAIHITIYSPKNGGFYGGEKIGTD